MEKKTYKEATEILGKLKRRGEFLEALGRGLSDVSLKLGDSGPVMIIHRGDDLWQSLVLALKKNMQDLEDKFKEL